MIDIEAILNEPVPFAYQEFNRATTLILLSAALFNLKDLLYPLAFAIALTALINTFYGSRILGVKDLGLRPPRKILTLVVILLYIFMLIYSAFFLWRNRDHLSQWLWFAGILPLMLARYMARMRLVRTRLAPLLENPTHREQLRDALLGRLKKKVTKKASSEPKP